MVELSFLFWNQGRRMVVWRVGRWGVLTNTQSGGGWEHGVSPRRPVLLSYHSRGLHVA